MPFRVFNLDGVAEYLHVSRAEVEWFLDNSDIPFEKKGERIVFRKKAIDGWASQRILGLPKGELKDYHKGSSAKIHDLSRQHALIPELMDERWLEPALSSRTKPSVISDMVALAKKTGRLVYPEDLLRTLTVREQMASTALTGGVALLHPEHHEAYMFEDSFVVLGRAVQPIPFGSPDGQTTDLFFLICCQDERIHLHVLARLCMMCHHTSLILELRDASDRGGMFQALEAAEMQVVRGL